MELGLYPKRQRWYIEVHPSWMATRGKQQPKNTTAYRASGPFNLREIVARSIIWGYLSRLWTIRSNRSLSIGLLRFYVTWLIGRQCCVKSVCQIKSVCVCMCEKTKKYINLQMLMPCHDRDRQTYRHCTHTCACIGLHHILDHYSRSVGMY